MSFTELALIMFVALILFGPEDLPVIARAIGKIVFQVRKFMHEITREFNKAIDMPNNILDEVLKDPPNKTKKEKVEEKDTEEPEELLTYEEEATTQKPSTPMNENPLADLPSDIVAYQKDKQAGE